MRTSMDNRIIELYRVKEVDGDVGIEIEMEGKALPPAPLGWRHAEDGSLRGNALEYVLVSPVPEDKVEHYLKQLDQQFKNAGSTLIPSDRCGVHIHINVQNMTFRQVINYACLYLLFENPLIEWCGEDRVGNLFCLRAEDADAIMERLIHALPYGTFANSFHRDGYRYASVNFDAIGKYGSLEFRAMKTTAKFVKPITTWASVLMRLKNKSLEFKDVLSTVQAFSVNNPIPFAKVILGPLYEEFACHGMEEMLRNGVRRVQDVAYAEQLKIEKPQPKLQIDKRGMQGPFRPAGEGGVAVAGNPAKINEAINKLVFEEHKALIRKAVVAAAPMPAPPKRDRNGKFAKKVGKNVQPKDIKIHGNDMFFIDEEGWNVPNDFWAAAAAGPRFEDREAPDRE